MIAITDPFMANVKPSGIQKGRGGFYRSADDAPYVSDPTGALVQSGPRKGEVCRLKYGSPSGVGRLIENDVGLTKFKQRLTLLGIGMDTSLAEACRDLVPMEAGSEEFRKAADTIVVEADRLTRSWLAADRGSHGHAICERWDEGKPWADIIPDGLALGIDTITQDNVAREWCHLLEENGLAVLAIEAPCVDDRWRLAGTLDRLVRTTRPLRFAMPGGEIVTIPAGIVVVLDIKFGAPRRAHLIQIASYAQSVPYDTETETRGEWPWEISQEHALIAHGDFGGEGRPVSIGLLWVDLVAGREHGGACVAAAKAWSGREDLWSVAQLDVEGVGDSSPSGQTEHGGAPSTLTVPEPVEESVPPAPGSGTTDVEGVGTPCLNPYGVAEPSTLDDVFEAIHNIAGESASPDASPAMEKGGTTLARAGFESLTAPSIATPDPARLAIVDARATLATTPAQGADLSGDYAALWHGVRKAYDALDPASRSWIADLSREATRRNLSFHTVTCRTERSYHIARALVALATAEADNTEILRALLALVVGDVALFVGVAPGHLVGSLSHLEAERFAGLVDAFHADQLQAWVDHDMVYRLRELSPA